MGHSAKIRHRRRRRAQMQEARAAYVAEVLGDLILKPLQQRRRLPLGFVEVEPVDGVRQIVPGPDSLDDALARALRDLDPVPSGQEPRAKSQEPPR